MGGSIIRKNSPTVAQDVTRTQKQLSVNGAGELMVNSTGLLINGNTSYEDVLGVSQKSTVAHDDDPTGVNPKGVVMAAFNQVNTSFRFLRQNDGNGLSTTGAVVKNPTGSIVIASATNSNPVTALSNCINNLPPTSSAVIEILDTSVFPLDAAFTTFQAIIVYSLQLP